MQTFLPHPSLVVSVMRLDWRRLGKQRVEGRQIQHAIQTLRARAGLTGVARVSADDWSEACRKYRVGWASHACTVMWRNHVQALMLYTDCAIREWVRRGYQNTMPLMLARGDAPDDIHESVRSIEMPPWLGRPELHESHRRMLLQKDPEWYSQWGWTERPEGDYVWPRD